MTRAGGGRLVIAVLGGALTVSWPLAGQHVSARAVIAAPKSEARVSGVTIREGGTWAGLEVELSLGRFTLVGSGTRGKLTPSDPGTFPSTDVGETAVNARVRVSAWLAAEARYTGRAFSSATGFERWDIVGMGAAASHDLGAPSVRAYADLELLPIVRLRHTQSGRFGLRSEVGITVAPPRSPLEGRVGYAVERYTFAASAAHAAQFEAFTLSLGVRAWRHAGRWSLGGGS